MENLEQRLLNNDHLDHWHHQHYALESSNKNEKDHLLLKDGDTNQKLLEWISIQNKITNGIPVELRNKSNALEFDFAEKDKIWEIRYGQLADFVKINGHSNIPLEEENYEVLRDWLNRQIQDKQYLNDNQVHKLEQLGIKWELALTRDHKWELMYLKLKEFHQIFAHSRVPQNWEPDPSLANWVSVQRRMKAAQKIRPDREIKLNALHFVWHIQVQFDTQWQRCYDELKMFLQAHGHCRVPGSNKPLTSWLENQRTAKKNKVLSGLREQQLNDLGFIWDFKALKENNWHCQLRQLKVFKKKYGHCLVPVKYKEDLSLGYWVAGQRKLEAKGQLAPTKIQQLDELGFVWSRDTLTQLQLSYDAQWNLNFERLKIYQQVYNTCQVSLKVNPVLQRWTRWQRKLFYEGKLAAERLAQLDAINFPWRVQEGYWMKMYQALVNFKNQFGHTRVPYQWTPNRQLAAWVYRLKTNQVELSPQKVELLNRITFEWNQTRKTRVAWEQMYERLLEFKQKYGHTRVPVKWPPDPKLGKWVSRMRQEKEKLNPERYALLSKVAFDWGYSLAETVL